MALSFIRVVFSTLAYQVMMVAPALPITAVIHARMRPHAAAQYQQDY
jgi:hypothetical protein